MENIEFWQLGPNQQLEILKEKLWKAHQKIDALENELHNCQPEEECEQIASKVNQDYLKFLELKDKILELTSQSEAVFQELAKQQEKEKSSEESIESLKLQVEKRINGYQFISEQNELILSQIQQIQEELNNGINMSPMVHPESSQKSTVSKIESKSQLYSQQIQDLKEEKIALTLRIETQQKKSEDYKTYLAENIRKQEEINNKLSQEPDEQQVRQMLFELKKEMDIDSNTCYRVIFRRNELEIECINAEQLQETRKNSDSGRKRRNSANKSQNISNIEEQQPASKPRDSCQCSLF